MNDYSQELKDDPLGLGYAAIYDHPDTEFYHSAGVDTALAELLNSKAGTLPRESIARGHMAKVVLLPVHLALATADQAMHAKWDKVVSFLEAIDGIDPSEPHIAKMFADLVADGLVSQAAVDNVSVRSCSRAEMLFGAGTIATPTEMSTYPHPHVASKREIEAQATADQWKADTLTDLISQAKDKITNTVQGKICDLHSTKGFIPANDPFSVALQAVLDATPGMPIPDQVIETLAHAEMMRTGGGK